MPAKNLQRAAEGGAYCHVYNRGIDNRNIFADDVDYQVFLGYLEDYLSVPKSPESAKKDFTINGKVFKGVPHQPKNYLDKVELIAYSLKPDHFHLILHQKTQKSLQAFLRSLCTRYSMYFNKKYNRSGSLFEGPYKSANINDETSLLLLSRFLHKEGGYSSFDEYSGQKHTPWVITKVIQSLKNLQDEYQDFVHHYEPSLTELKLLNDIIIENINPQNRLNVAQSPAYSVPESTETPYLSPTMAQPISPNSVVIKPWLRIPELLFASTLFVLLLGIGVKNISVGDRNSQVLMAATLGIKTTAFPPRSAILTPIPTTDAAPSPTPTPTPSPVPSPEPTLGPQAQIVLLVKPTAKPLEIREKPQLKSQKVGIANSGDKFDFVSQQSNWYEIRLPEGTTGFIESKYLQNYENK